MARGTWRSRVPSSRSMTITEMLPRISMPVGFFSRPRAGRRQRLAGGPHPAFQGAEDQTDQQQHVAQRQDALRLLHEEGIHDLRVFREGEPSLDRPLKLILLQQAAGIELRSGQGRDQHKGATPLPLDRHLLLLTAVHRCDDAPHRAHGRRLVLARSARPGPLHRHLLGDHLRVEPVVSGPQQPGRCRRLGILGAGEVSPGAPDPRPLSPVPPAPAPTPFPGWPPSASPAENPSTR